jgi:hypothetical protein
MRSVVATMLCPALDAPPQRRGYRICETAFTKIIHGVLTGAGETGAGGDC